MIGQTISHYRIVESLAEGGMGAVYIAEDTLLGRRVAIKFPTDGSDRHHSHSRFLREARAVSALSHPYIATIYDYGETGDGQPFIVMELVNGQTLSELLAEGSLNIERAIRIIEQVAEALAEAHARGIIHRDIKPSNIIIGEQGQVKVLDFGLAKHLHEESARASADPNARTLLATHTRSGVVLGTPLYLSPEQARGRAVDGRSDLFALGAVFYECITGKPAFSVANAGVIEIAYNVIHVDPVAPSVLNPDVPDELDLIARKALAKNPDERYQTAEEMIRDLRAAQSVLAGLEPGHRRTRRITPAHSTGPAHTLQTISKVLGRPRIPIFVVVGIVLLCGLAAWLIVRSMRPKAHQPTTEAERWYQTGTSALRDGAYYQASKAFEQAVAADDLYALAHARLAEAWMELDYTDRAKDELLRVGSLVGDRSALPQLDRLYLDAIIATASRDFAPAIAAYTEIARLLPNQAHVYVDLGRAYENADDSKRALESYLKATTIDPQYATAFLRAAMLYGRQQDLASATSAFDKAETVYQALGNTEGRAEVAFQRGSLLVKIGKSKEARPQLQQALELSRAVNNQFQQIKTMLQMVYVLQSEGETEQAEQFATEAVQLAQAGGMENLTARGLVDLGNAFMVRGNYSEADKYFNQALDFSQRSKARRNEARALLSLGSLRVQQSRADEASRYIEQALAFYQQAGYRKEISIALTLLGRANRLKGDYDGALKAYQQQLQSAEQVGDSLQQALSHEGIGTVLAQQERYPEALAHFEQKYGISKQLGDQRGTSYGLMEQGGVFWQLGRYNEARQALDQALALAGQAGAGNTALLAFIHQSKAGMLMSERRFKEARDESQQALTLAGKQSPDLAASARSIIGLAETFSGMKSEGRSSCQEAVTAAERLGDPWLLSQSLLALAQSSLEDGDAQAALQASLRAQEAFSRSGQRASEWRAWVVAAFASRKAGDEAKATEYAGRAASVLDSIQSAWGAEAYNSYLNRPDVQFSRKQLGTLLAGLK